MKFRNRPPWGPMGAPQPPWGPHGGLAGFTLHVQPLAQLCAHLLKPRPAQLSKEVMEGSSIFNTRSASSLTQLVSEMNMGSAGGSAAARTRGGAQCLPEFIELVEGGWAHAGTQAAWGARGTRKSTGADARVHVVVTCVVCRADRSHATAFISPPAPSSSVCLHSTGVYLF